MAINPLIPLQAQTPDVGSVFNNTLVNLQNLESLRQAPMRNRLLAAQTQGAEIQNQEARRKAYIEANKDKIANMAMIAQQAVPALEKGDIMGARSAILGGLDQAESMGFSPADFEEQMDLLESDPATFLQRNKQLIALNQQINPNQGSDKAFAPVMIQNDQTGQKQLVSPVYGGQAGSRLEPYQLPQGYSLTSETPYERRQGDVEASIEKKRGEKLAEYDVSMSLEPQLRGLVRTAEKNAESLAAQAEKTKTGQDAFAVYDAAMSGLAKSMGVTTTGPFIGMLPAVTANQQIADGAVAAMAPVLKQLFRAAGEGVFTDKDQELLLAMVPTRSDYQEARLAKMQNIDTIVRAKLGIPQPKREQDLGFDPDLLNYMTPEERAVFGR